MNIEALMKAKKAWDTFTGNHPKFPAFLKDVKGRGVPEGTVVEIQFKYPDGNTIKTNMKITESDTALLQSLGIM